MDFLTRDEVITVMKAAKAKSARAWAMALLSYKHGLRPSECCRLRLTDVDLREGVLIVKRAKGSLDGRHELLGHKGMPLLDEYRAVKAWVQQRGDDPSPFLFTSQKSKQVDRSTWYRDFAAVAHAAGIDRSRRHPHLLRHTLASHMAHKHADVLEIKQRMGHKSIQSTLVYTHISDRQADAAAKRVLAELF